MIAAKKILSVLTLGCFLFSFVFAETIHAAVAAGIAAPAPEGSVISRQAGRITDACFVNGLKPGKVVVAIQDLHCHPEVQRNISRILSELDKEFSLKNVYVEGGYGDVDTSWLCNIKDRELKKEITENLVDQGKLTGSEYYSVLANRPDLLKGIEDEALHKANIVRLGRVFERKPRFEQTLKLFDRDLAFMEAKYFSRRNREFNKLVEKYRNGGIPADKYYKLLGKYARMINAAPGKCNNVFAIDMADYRNIKTYLELTAAAERLDYKKVSRQMQQFISLLRTKLPYSVYTSLLEKTDNFSKTDELYLLCAGLAKEHHLDLAAFPDLQRFFDYTEKSRAINPVRLLEEEKRLVEEIRTGLSENMTEAEISFLADFYSCFRDYLLNRLQADDYAYFSERFDKFRHTWAKYAFEDRFPVMNADLELLNEFYSTNCRRNEYFLNSISSLCAASDTEPVGQASGLRDLLKRSELTVIVTGGFHTDGLKTLFRDRGISYLTITPNVTKDAQPASDTYARLAKHQAEILSNALQLGLASQALIDEKFQFYMDAANRELRGINFTEKNFDALLDKLKEVLGEVHIAAAVFDEKAGRATVTFSNGRTITLTRDAGRDSFKAAVEGFNRLMVASAEEAVSQTAAVLNAEIVTADALIGLVGLIHGTGSAYMNIMKFAAEHDLVIGDGYIYELKEDPKLLDLVNRELQGIAAPLPAAAQEAALERVERKLRLEETGKANRLYEVLLAIGFVKDFLVATNGIPHNAAFGDWDFENAEINQAVAAGLANNTLSIDRDLTFHVEGTLLEFLPYIMPPDFDTSYNAEAKGSRAYQELSKKLGNKGKDLSLALTELLEQVTLLPVATEEGLFEYKGKKFAVAHSGFGGETANGQKRNIYYAVKKDGTFLFTGDELVVIIFHELVHLLFKEYGSTAWYIHDIATIMHQKISEHLFGSPEYVDEKFRQIRNGIIQRRPPGSAIPDKYFEGNDNEVTHFNDNDPYDMDKEIEKLAQLSEAKAAGLDITRAVEEFGRELLNDADLPEYKRQLFFAFLGLYFSNNDADVTKSIKLLPSLLMKTGYSLVGNPKSHDFIIGSDTQRLEIRTVDMSNVYVYIHDTFMKAVNHGLPGGVIDENGFIHLFFENIDESYLMQLIGRSLAGQNAGEGKSDRLAQLSALLNPRYNGRYLAEMIADAGKPDNGGDNDSAVKENLKALYKARTGREMPVLNIDVIENTLRGLKPGQITELAEKVIATGAFFEYQSHAARFIENVEFTTRMVQALGAEYLQILKKDIRRVEPESQYSVLEKEAYVQSAAAIREQRYYDARELMKEIVLAHYENRYEDAERTISKLDIDNLFDEKARAAALARLQLKDAEIPLSLGYSFSAIIEEIEINAKNKGFRQSPDAAVADENAGEVDDFEDYDTNAYVGEMDMDLPFDELFRTLETLSRLKTDGKDISGEIEKLRRKILSDGSLPARKKLMIDMFLDRYLADKIDPAERLILLLPGLLQGTGYIFLSVPKLRAFILGKPFFPTQIGTVDLGPINLLIYSTIMSSGKHGFPRGMSDGNGDIYAFTSEMTEGTLVHEAAHSIDKKIDRKRSKLMGERLADLASLLNTRDNGQELANVIKKVRISQKRITHDEARENNLKALYEARTGETMTVFDIDTVENALRGLRPSEIAALVENTVYEGGFFFDRKDAERFILNLKQAIQHVHALIPMLQLIIERVEPGKLQEKDKVNDAFLQSLEAIKENRQDDAVWLMEEVVYDYYNRFREEDPGSPATFLEKVNLSSVYNGDKRKMLLKRLKGRDIPLRLGYLLAALIEDIDIYSAKAKASPDALADKAVLKVVTIIRLGILDPFEEVSEGIVETILAKLENMPFFETWLDSKVRRDARLKQLIIEGKVIDYTTGGKAVQLVFNRSRGDGSVTETPAEEKYQQLYQERVKNIFGILEAMHEKGQVPDEIRAYLDKRVEKNGLTGNEKAQLLEKITDPRFRIRVVKDAYFTDSDPLSRANVIAHAALGEHYGPQRAWLPEQAIRILSAEEVVKILIEEGLHMVRPEGKHGKDIIHDEDFLNDVSRRLREAQSKDRENPQSPGISAVELLTLLSEDIRASLDAGIGGVERKKQERYGRNSLVRVLLDGITDEYQEEISEEIGDLLAQNGIVADENGDISLKSMLKALIAGQWFHVAEIAFPDDGSVSLIVAYGVPYNEYLQITLKKNTATQDWVAVSSQMKRDEELSFGFTHERLNALVERVPADAMIKGIISSTRKDSSSLPREKETITANGSGSLTHRFTGIIRGILGYLSMGKIGGERIPQAERYDFVNWHIGKAENGFPFDNEIIRIIELFELKAAGEDIIKDVQAFQESIRENASFTDEQREYLSDFAGLYLSGDKRKIERSINILPALLQGTGYVFVGMPMFRSFAVGKPMKFKEIGTADLGTINININRVLIGSNGNGQLPGAMHSEANGDVYVFTDLMNERVMLHELGHSVFQRILGKTESNVIDERIAMLSELLSPRYNGIYLSDAIKDAGAHKKTVTHDWAWEDNLRALYEVKTGMPLPVFDIDKVEAALRGLSPLEIKDLVVKVIYTDTALFGNKAQAERFIHNMGFVLGPVQELAAEYTEEAKELVKEGKSDELPLNPENIFIYDTYIRGLQAVRENRRDDATRLIRETMDQYFDQINTWRDLIAFLLMLRHYGAYRASGNITRINMANLFEKDAREKLSALLKNKYFSLKLGYMFAAFIEAIGTGEGSDAGAGSDAVAGVRAFPVSHIIGHGDKAAALKNLRPGDAVYAALPSTMSEAEKNGLSPVGIKVAFEDDDINVYSEEQDGVAFYYLDLKGITGEAYDEALRQGAEQIEREGSRVPGPKVSDAAMQNDRVIIDYSLTGRKVRYNANGTPVASPYYLGKAGHLRKIKKGEAWAANQTMLTYLDDVENIEDFKETLNVAMNVGNGMMVINPGVIENIGKIYKQYEDEGKKKILRNYHNDRDEFILKKTAQIAKCARSKGNEIFISLLKGSPEELAAMKERYKDTAVAGYVFMENGRMAAYHFATGEVRSIAEIRDYNIETLGSKIKAAPESAYKMVYSSDLRRLVRGEKDRIRAIDEKTALFDLLKPFLISLYDPSKQLTKQFVENVAFGWDRDALPKMEPAEFQGVVDAIEDEKSSVNDILAKMGLGEGISHPVKTYVLDKLAGDLQGPDREKELEQLQRDFLRAIIREVLVNEKMKGAVLADVELRDILGRKLYQRLKEKITDTEPEISAQEFIRQNNVNATTFFILLNAKIRQLNAAAGSKAINAIIELAPLGDRGIKLKKQREVIFNATSIDAILAAA